MLFCPATLLTRVVALSTSFHVKLKFAKPAGVLMVLPLKVISSTDAAPFAVQLVWSVVVLAVTTTGRDCVPTTICWVVTHCEVVFVTFTV